MGGEAVLTFLVGVFGGVLTAVSTAILTASWRARKKPKLSVQLQETLDSGRIGKSSGAYARLAIVNEDGRAAATDVSLKIMRVSGGSSDDSENLHFLSQPWQLAWANADSGDPNVPPEVKDVPPGYPGLMVDLAHLNSGVHGKMIIDVRPQQNQRNYLGHGTFTVDLVLDAANAAKRYYAVDLVHDGETWDGKYTSANDRLLVKNLRPVGKPGS